MEKELLRNAVQRPATLLYPFEKVPPVERMRGKVAWEIEKCIGCGLCSRICPSDAIEMTGTGTNAEIRYYLDRCLFCGECVDICPTKAIETTSEFELASTSRRQMVIDFKRSSTKSMPKTESS